MKNVYTMICPQLVEPLPIIFDSPHSGLGFPEEFKCNADINQLKTGWDAYIEDLWSEAVNQGAHLLFANFSRMYVDLNRNVTDIDPLLVEDKWPSSEPTKYSERGMGLIRRFALPGVPMYDHKLTHEELTYRIENFYTPYHSVLSLKLQELKKQYGSVWHINCHSMKSVGNKMNIDAGKPRPDIVLGDCDGQACNIEFRQCIEDAFVKLGYQVAVNDPYKGGYLVTNYGAPSLNINSIQIEVNRRLYMDEASFEPSLNYQNFKRDLSIVSEQISKFVEANITRK